MEDEEYNALVTRAVEYQRTQESVSSSPPSSSRPADHLPKRNSVFLKCQAHCDTSILKKFEKWGRENTSCPSCLKYDTCDEFRSGILPRQKEVLEGGAYS